MRSKFLEVFKNTRLVVIILALFTLLFSAGTVILTTTLRNKPPNNSPTIPPIPSATNTQTPTPPPNITSTPTPKPLKIIFGMGSQAGPAMGYRLIKEAPVHMLTSWYNGTKDLGWMRIQQNDLIPRLYKNKFIVHLITWTDLPEENIQTPYGPACGRPYPVSAQVVEDMKQLAQIYNGPGIMYVSLFTEFQTYTCTDNNWNGNENYYKTLKDNYKKIAEIFHSFAPRSKVSLSWGSWQSTYDDKEHQGGRSLFAHFADTIKQSDFASFQAMESYSNVQEIKDMTRILGSYGKPVMLAHYKPASGSHDVFDNDLKSIFTDGVMKELINNGLFAMSFMDSELIDSSESSYILLKNGIIKYGK